MKFFLTCRSERHGVTTYMQLRFCEGCNWWDKNSLSFRSTRVHLRIQWDFCRSVFSFLWYFVDHCLSFFLWRLCCFPSSMNGFWLPFLYLHTFLPHDNLSKAYNKSTFNNSQFQLFTMLYQLFTMLYQLFTMLYQLFTMLYQLFTMLYQY